MSISLFDSARTIYEAALRAVKPDRLVREKISRDGSRLIVEGEAIETVGAGGVDLLAVGKAAPAMAGALAEILGDLLGEGLIVGLPGADPHLKSLKYLPGSHPLPDARRAAAGRAALDLAEQMRRHHHRDAKVRAGALDQIQHLVAAGWVQAGGRLVEEQQLGVVGEGLGEFDPLLHAR